jgi:hypothetical protein
MMPHGITGLERVKQNFRSAWRGQNWYHCINVNCAILKTEPHLPPIKWDHNSEDNKCYHSTYFLRVVTSNQMLSNSIKSVLWHFSKKSSCVTDILGWTACCRAPDVGILQVCVWCPTSTNTSPSRNRPRCTPNWCERWQRWIQYEMKLQCLLCQSVRYNKCCVH